LGGLRGEVENVEVGPAAVIQSGISEVHVSKSEYLASREVIARVSHFIYSTVSADDNSVGRTQHYHRSRETVGHVKKDPECAYPKYLRRNDTETVTKLFANPWMIDIDGHDFDASCDGVTWFHLFGDYCIKRCPLF
jgi:hypothetical protein